MDHDDGETRQAEDASLAGRHAHIAVAEDDDDMRTLVADVLRRDGHRVVELPTGAALLSRIARQYRHLDPAEPLDLVITDIHMPVITGLEILRGLREAQLQTPVILMTAFGDRATRREAESLGAVLIDKPLSLDELRQEVRRLLAA